MPRGDGTGPAGQGPMTGRGMGYCAGFNAPGFMNPGLGRAFGWGGAATGFRRGFRRFGFGMPFVQPQVITEREEKEILQEELEALKQEMKEIEKRLKELK
jgi:hypothetical protein